MSDHTIVANRVVKTFFVQFFCVFLPPLLNLFCICYVLAISVLYWAHHCMKCSLGISHFLEEISSLSHSIVFVYLSLPFFGTLHSDGYIFFFSPLPLVSLLFSASCKASSDYHFALLHFFSLGMVLITASCTMSQMPVHNSSGTLPIRSHPFNLFVSSTV